MTKSNLNRTLILISYLSGIIFMTACGSSTENIPTQISSEEEIEVVSTPTPLPEMPTETPETIDACLNCHADKQRLIDTTAPEEEVVEENKGAG